MKRYYNIFIVTTILLMGSSSLSAQCVDDVTNAYAPYGMDCASVLATGMSCSAAMAGIPLMDECPLSCDNCPPDCAANGPTSHGCCLPENNIYVDENGSVLYNSVSVCVVLNVFDNLLQPHLDSTYRRCTKSQNYLV